MERFLVNLFLGIVIGKSLLHLRRTKVANQEVCWLTDALSRVCRTISSKSTSDLEGLCCDGETSMKCVLIIRS